MIRFEDLNRYRLFLESVWVNHRKQWNPERTPKIVSTYMCRYSCIFLINILKKEYELDCQIINGRPKFKYLEGTKFGKYGYKDVKGKWYDHSWITLNNKIIDLTSDQFGGDKVVFTTINNCNYNPSPNQKAFEQDFTSLTPVVNKWIKYYEASYVD